VTADQSFLRRLVLEAVGRRPRTGSDLYEEVNGIYGSLPERRFWRVLSKLVASGAVKRTGTLHKDSEYERPSNK
jgi:hypothetical protein